MSALWPADMFEDNYSVNKWAVFHVVLRLPAAQVQKSEVRLDCYTLSRCTRAAHPVLLNLLAG